MTIMDLLFKGGGLKDNFFKESTYLKKADLIRPLKNKFNKKILNFSIQDILDQKEPNFLLMRGDKVRLYSKRMFNANQSVIVNGTVKSPGEFFLKSNMTVVDAILEAGGIAESVLHCRVDVSRLNPESVSDSRYAEVFTMKLTNDSTIFDLVYHSKESLSLTTKNQNIKLEPFDVITVREDPYFQKPKIITISGKVFTLANI